MTKPVPLTKDILDQMAMQGCQHPDCKGHHEDHAAEVSFNPSCHPHGGAVIVYYVAGSGKLRLECFVCENLVCEIAVASQT